MDNSPLVTIGMPTYNGEQFIREALDSLLAQDFEDFELIISDNASTDKTSGICKEYATRDSRIKYYRNDKNIGPVANFDRLIDLAKGTYFMWAADDDLWEPQFISQMLDALKNNPGAVLSFCKFDVIEITGKIMFINDKDPMAEICEKSLFNRLLPRCYVKLWGMNMAIYIYGLMKKDILLNCRKIESSVDAYKGWDLVTVFHLLSYGTFVRVNKILFHRRANLPRLSDVKNNMIRLRKRSISSFFLKWYRDLHGHYFALRRIVQETSLNSFQKTVLIIVLYVAETKHYTRSIIVYLLSPNREQDSSDAL